MASIFPITVPSKRLAASINAGSISFQLNNILGWNAEALTASDFGTKAYGVFRNDSNTQMEIFEWDPTTIAAGAITFVRRGLKFTGDLTTEVTANKLTWVKNETIVELGADVPQLLNHMVRIVGSPSIVEQLAYSTELVPLDRKDIPTWGAVQDLAAGGSVSINRIVVAGDAGETVSAGQGVYLDETDNEWKKWDADTAATLEGVMLGIAQGSGTNGNAIIGGVLLLGLDDNQSGLTQGDLLYAGNTAGAIVTSAGTTARVVGIARTATSFYFNPNFYYTLKSDQKAALAGGGNMGTPSSVNRFVTEVGIAGSFGTGEDGDVTISSPTTLTRTMYYNNLTVNDDLDTAGYQIFVKETLSGTGKIFMNGSDGTNGGDAASIGGGGNPGAAGVGAAAYGGFFATVAGGDGTGGAGQSSGGAGEDGADTEASPGDDGPAGGNGGNGTSGNNGGAGGAGGDASIGRQWGIFAAETLLGATITQSSGFTLIVPGGGAGGGGAGAGGNASNSFGGGSGGAGSSGGIIFIMARTWAGNFVIEALGGDGGNGGAAAVGSGSTAGGGGGGAGGNGGIGVVIYGEKTWSGTFELDGGTGGTGGSGTNNGGTGSDGNDGVSFEIRKIDLI